MPFEENHGAAKAFMQWCVCVHKACVCASGHSFSVCVCTNGHSFSCVCVCVCVCLFVCEWRGCTSEHSVRQLCVCTNGHVFVWRADNDTREYNESKAPAHSNCVDKIARVHDAMLPVVSARGQKAQVVRNAEACDHQV